MMWFWIIGFLVLIIAIGVFFEKKRKSNSDDSKFSKKEEEELKEDYIKKGSTNETDNPRKL